LAPTLLGKMITEILSEYFPDVIGTGFTADMEKLLDQVEEETVDWVAAMKEFYFPFKARLDEVMSTLSSKKGQLDEATDIVCDLCGKPMVKKLGRFGFFLACSGSLPARIRNRFPSQSAQMRRRHRAEKCEGKAQTLLRLPKYQTCVFMATISPTDKLCLNAGCSWLKDRQGVGRPQGVHQPACDYLHSKTKTPRGMIDG